MGAPEMGGGGAAPVGAPGPILAPVVWMRWVLGHPFQRGALEAQGVGVRSPTVVPRVGPRPQGTTAPCRVLCGACAVRGAGPLCVPAAPCCWAESSLLL